MADPRLEVQTLRISQLHVPFHARVKPAGRSASVRRRIAGLPGGRSEDSANVTISGCFGNTKQSQLEY